MCFLHQLLNAGGFGSYLLGLNRKIYEQAGVDSEGNNPGGIKEPRIGWMTGFLFLSCPIGLLALVPLRKVCLFLLFSFLAIQDFQDKLMIDSFAAISLSPGS